VSILSERIKLTAVQENLKKIRKRERLGKIIVVIGSLFLVVGVILSSFGFTSNILYIASVGLCFFGAIDIYRYSRMKRKVLTALDHMIVIKRCSNCGKELPKGDLVFCPFCSLKLVNKSES
jgi:predicted nucleic acid-binding Zn ribbon protein